MKQDKKWREFERLITRIETLLAPKGATIKSPDKIPDRVTGVLREVDASIRYNIGSVPILITIECRDRQGKQDIQWLEQIASKKQSVGANQTIVVSRNGLTEPALNYARQQGLIVRQIGDITDQFILQCKNSLQVSWKRIGWKNVTCNIGFYATEADKGKTKIKTTSEVDKKMREGKAFAIDQFGEEVTMQELFQEAFEGIKMQIEIALEDAPEVPAKITAEFDPNNMQIETENGQRFIQAIIFSATFFMDVKSLPPLQPVVYLDEKGEKIVSFSETHDPETGQGVTIQFGWDDDGQKIAKK